MLWKVCDQKNGPGGEFNLCLPFRHSVAIPTGYPWRVAPLQSPLPFYRLPRRSTVFADRVKLKLDIQTRRILKGHYPW